MKSTFLVTLSCVLYIHARAGHRPYLHVRYALGPASILQEFVLQYLSALLSQTDSAGAGHAGRGGHGSDSSFPGQAYGSVREPRDHGSGGVSSRGGGVIRLSARGHINVDGLVTAKGEDSPANAAGGASGGSVWITCSTFLGNGAVVATGGGGMGTGGGGGGGRIAVDYENKTFSGKIEAAGGPGDKEPGGAGTIFFHNTYESSTKLLVDNRNVGAPSSDDIQDPALDGGRTWLTPAASTTVMAFDEVSSFMSFCQSNIFIP